MGAALPLSVRKRIALAICPERVGGAPADGGLSIEVSTLPVWGNGRRPNFWPDLDVRAFLTGCHRQMTIAQCRKDCAALFGAGRTPSASAVHRYWMVLDEARELRRGRPETPKSVKEAS